MTFEEFWPSGDWLKLGKKAAERHFDASVKTDADVLSIQRARDNYRLHLKQNDWKRPQHGSTWFNQWKDWAIIDVPISVQERDLFACVPEVKQETHYCDVCQTRYPCPEPETCGAGDSVICRKCYAEVFRK